ncbi:MAG: ComEC family competence protein [Lentisphaeria bacterium]|nr:ComEC family competence protein [Lentisphaeria bacterium]NQZ69512.1 ComEC family competence protein [Lentisphaeria bacterium]
MKHLMQLNKFQLTSEHLRPYPAFAPAIAISLGILCTGLSHFEYLSFYQAVMLSSFFFLLCLVFIADKRLELGVCFIAGLVISCLHSYSPWVTYDDELTRPRHYAEIRATIVDKRLMKSPELQSYNPNRNIEVEIHELKTYAHDWKKVSGRIVIRKVKEQYNYGDKLTMTGQIQEIESSALPGLFNYKAYMKSKHIDHHFSIYESKVDGSSSSVQVKLMQRFLHFREQIALRLIENVDSDSQKILLAMSLGIKQGLNADDKQIFLKSGGIHLFAVSGLHVGILFTIILFFLSITRVPYNVRYLLIPFLLLVYVLITGAGASSVRAWLMLSIWSLGKGFKLYAPSINSVLVAAIILLVVNPFFLFQSGFQFSFTIVICLILGWKICSEILQSIRERDLWTPFGSGLQTRRNRTAVYLLKSLMAMGCAWLGVLGLSLAYNQLFLPFSLILNLVLGVLAWLILFLAVLKLFVSFIPIDILADMLSSLLSVIIGSLYFLNKFSSENSLIVHCRRPVFLMTLIYYGLLLTVLLVPFKLKRTLLIFSTLTAFVLFNLVYSKIPRNELTILQSKHSNKPIIIYREGSRYTLINPGPGNFSYTLNAYLKMQGITKLEAIVIFANLKEYHAATSKVIDKHSTASIYLVNQSHHNVKQIASMSHKNQIPFKQSTEQIDTVNFRLSSKNTMQYEAKNTGVIIQLKNNGDYNPELLIKQKDKIIWQGVITNTNTDKILYHKTL